MNPLRKATALLAAFASSAAAGALNVVQLGPPDVIRFEVKSGGISQQFDLPHGGSTGRFVLPEKEAATLSLPNREAKNLNIPATAEPNIAVLTMEGEKDIWKLIPGKPTKDKWALRAVNLSAKPAVIEGSGKPLEIPAGATVEIPTAGKADISILIIGSQKHSYDGKEPCAIVALIYEKDSIWQVLFVPDR